MEELTIRPIRDTDRAFVINSLLKSFEKECPFKIPELVPSKLYFSFHGRILNWTLDRSTTCANILIPKDDPDVIIGYVLYEITPIYRIVHYLYIKEAFRKFGFATLLIKSLPFDLSKKTYTSHMTKAAKKLIRKNRITYNPYLI